MTLKEAIKEMKDQRDSLVKHYNKGGEYAKPQLEATDLAIACMEKAVPRALKLYQPQPIFGYCPSCKKLIEEAKNYCHLCGQRIDLGLSECIARRCIDCPLHDYSSKVCKYYAEKSDEIRLMLEEEK